MGNGCSVHGVARRKLGKRDIQWLVAHTQFSSEAEIATLYRGEKHLEWSILGQTEFRGPYGTLKYLCRLKPKRNWIL